MTDMTTDKGPKPYHEASPRSSSAPARDGLLPGEWHETKYPGDAAVNLDLIQGDELGMVRIQVYGAESFMVASYLPGRSVFNPGDTPKVEPERAAWCETREDANKLFTDHVVAAFRAGWKVWKRES